MFGVECYSGNTFTIGNTKLALTSMHVPAPVISLSLTPTKKNDSSGNFGKALNRFQKEDPTFRVKMDPQSGQTIISGMGELHLAIYVERMKREYNVDANTGQPLVAYKETISQTTPFDYTHKKQSGGAGQYARITGIIEELPEGADPPLEFEDQTVGAPIPVNFMEAIRKGFVEGCEKGPMVGAQVVSLRLCITGGDHHPVDSSDLAFKICIMGAMRETIKRAKPIILEPIMIVEVQTPIEYQGGVVGQLCKRKAIIDETKQNSNEFVTIRAFVPLANMFGYSTDLRSATQGKAEFAMEYKCHEPVPQSSVPTLVEEAARRRAEELKNRA
jgi:elongation factor G